MAADIKQGKAHNCAFMACILKVEINSTGWRKIVTGLAKIQGVSSFRMDQDGMIELSGTFDSTLLLEMLAKSKAGKLVKICWWQFGQCYSNLYIPTEQIGSSQCSYCRGGYGNYGGQCYSNLYIPTEQIGSSQCSYCRGGYGNYGGDARYLHYDHQYSANRPKPKTQYQSFEKKAPTQTTGEAVECCCLM